MPIEERLDALHGCARTAQLVRSPTDAAELRRLLRVGRVVRRAHGVYAYPATIQEVCVARIAGGLVTCASLGRLLGLPRLERSSAVHVALPGHRGAPRSSALPSATVLHWDSTVGSVGDRTVAPVSMALAHAATCLPLREAVALGDAALNRGTLQLEDLLGRRPRVGRLAFDRYVRALDGRSQSMPESFLRLALRQTGVVVEPQVGVLGVGRVDLLVGDLVVVEVDGFAYHGDRRQYREDRRRDRVMHLLGLPVLRFTFEDVVHDVDRAVGEVLAMLDHARRTGVRPLAADQVVRSM